MPLETFLIIDFQPADDDTVAKLSSFLEDEVSGRIRVFDTGFSTDQIPAGDESSGIGYFSEVEKLLRKISEIFPGFSCHGKWEVDFTVADSPPDSWSFDWSGSQVENVIDELAEMFQTANSQWDKVFQKSELLQPEMFEHWMFELLSSPEMTLLDLEEMVEADPEYWADEPFDDDETLTYPEVVCELRRVLDDGK